MTECNQEEYKDQDASGLMPQKVMKVPPTHSNTLECFKTPPPEHSVNQQTEAYILLSSINLEKT